MITDFRIVLDENFWELRSGDKFQQWLMELTNFSYEERIRKIKCFCGARPCKSYTNSSNVGL